MTTPIREAITYLQFKTPHYSFQMKVVRTQDMFNKIRFLVGNPELPCLEGNITLNYLQSNNRFKKYENRAKLIKIAALQECSLHDITTDYMNQYSFGQELLDAVLYFIHCQFENINTVSLNDASHIPCNRFTDDILDLLTYSIALYKKTWYEEKKNAYILPKEKHDEYRKQVEEYASKETKQQLSYDDFFGFVLKTGTEFSMNKFISNLDTYKQLYDESETLPIFFQKLSKTIPKSDKCKFFQIWLETFINSKIQIEREWHIDLYPKIKVIQESNMRPIRNKTRRQRQN